MANTPHVKVTEFTRDKEHGRYGFLDGVYQYEQATQQDPDPKHLLSAPDGEQGGYEVRISYNKLWHLILDKNMNKADLKRATGISTASIAKLRKGENVTTDILVKICETLQCELNDIMELAHDNDHSKTIKKKP